MLLNIFLLQKDVISTETPKSDRRTPRSHTHSHSVFGETPLSVKSENAHPKHRINNTQNLLSIKKQLAR